MELAHDYCDACHTILITAPSLPVVEAVPEGPIEHFWFMVEHGWDIEPRAYFEKEAVAMGFKSAVEMAVHHMWKRQAKEWPTEALAASSAAHRPQGARMTIA